MKKSEILTYRLFVTMSLLISGTFVTVNSIGYALATDGEVATNLDVDLDLKQLNECHDDTECVNNSGTLIETQSPPGQINVDVNSEIKQKNKCHDDTECENNSEDQINAGNIEA